ncbi:MAG TPA: hypothetical protein VGC08_15565, partial [Pedobacter sp.]
MRFRILVFGILMLVLSAHHAAGQTTDTTGIQFTEITDKPADTAVKPAPQVAAAKVQQSKTTVTKDQQTAAQKSLWGIFITGFVGGL